MCARISIALFTDLNKPSSEKKLHLKKKKKTVWKTKTIFFFGFALSSSKLVFTDLNSEYRKERKTKKKRKSCVITENQLLNWDDLEAATDLNHKKVNISFQLGFEWLSVCFVRPL